MKVLDAKYDLTSFDSGQLQGMFYRYLEHIGEVAIIADTGRRSPDLERIHRPADRRMLALYTDYARHNTWLLVEEAIPMLLRRRPGSFIARPGRRKHINRLKQQLCSQAFLDEPHRLKVVNYEDDLLSWRVLPWDFHTWINYLGLELPAELQDLIKNSQDISSDKPEAD